MFCNFLGQEFANKIVDKFLNLCYNKYQKLRLQFRQINRKMLIFIACVERKVIMAKFIEVETIYNSDAFINVDCISDIQREQDTNNALIYLVGDSENFYRVSNYDEVIKRIKAL